MMKAQFVNPFLKAIQDILNQITGMSMEIKKTNLNQTSSVSKDVAILIGVTGQLEGQTMINLDEHFAMKIASNMMGGMPVTEFDDISKSAVAELGNMILGNAASILYNEGYKIDITPPTLLTRESAVTWDIKQPMLSTTLENNLGIIEMNLALIAK